MTAHIIAKEQLSQPQSRTALRNVQLLVGCYLSLSMLTLVAIVLLRNNPTIVTPAVCVREPL